VWRYCHAHGPQLEMLSFISYVLNTHFFSAPHPLGAGPRKDSVTWQYAFLDLQRLRRALACSLCASWKASSCTALRIASRYASTRKRLCLRRASPSCRTFSLSLPTLSSWRARRFLLRA